MGSSDEQQQHFTRLIDAPGEEDNTMEPIQGYQVMPLVPLEKAVKPLEAIVENLQTMVSIAKQNCQAPADNLSPDESASIYLYTLEWKPQEKGLYYILNNSLRKKNKVSLKPWLLYLKLFLTSLSKLPNRRGIFYRGVKKDIRADYPDGKTFVWWPFTSCTSSPSVLQNDTFFGKIGDRTLFEVSSYSGKDIRKHSSICTEDEVLLPAARFFKVKGSMNAGHGVSIIHIEEIEPKHPLLEPLSSSSTGKGASSTSHYTNKKLEKLIQESESENLDLASEGLSDEDMAIVVAKGIIEKRPMKLNMMCNEITPSGALILAESLHNNSRIIKELVLSHNNISDAGVRFLSAALSNSMITILDLSENGISDEGAKYLATMLEKNLTLVELILEQNDIGNDGVQMLAESLKNATAPLQILNLYNNRKINDRSLDQLSMMLENNRSLTTLDIRGCSLTKDGEAKLQQLAKQRKGFRIKLSHFLR